MFDLYLSTDGLRAILVLILSVGQAVMSFWPEWRKWPETIPSRSERLSTPVVPIDWAFSIWGVIFLSSFAFAVYQALPAQLNDPLLRSIGWLAAALFAGNIAWQLYVPRRDIDWVSFAIIVAELALALAILFRIERFEPLEAPEFWLVSAPFQILGGWISAAAFVNLSSSLRRSGALIDTPRSLIFIVAAASLGAFISHTTGGVLYAATIAWALFGIAIANLSRERRPPVALTASMLIPLVLIASVIARG